MRILRLIQISGFLLCSLPMAVIGYQYFAHMTAPKDTGGAAFVSASGKTRTTMQNAPGFMDNAAAIIGGLLGREEAAQTGLAALKTRTTAATLTQEDLTMREIEFWTDFTAKLGFTGI